MALKCENPKMTACEVFTMADYQFMTVSTLFTFQVLEIFN